MSHAEAAPRWIDEALGRLDVLLADAVAAAGRGSAPQETVRGLRADTGRLPAGELSQPALPLPAGLPELDAFDAGVLALALAPEVDLAYERVFAFLHDDLGRCRPSVGLALELLCTNTRARAEARGRFAADAPLIRERLIALGDGSGPLLRRPFEADPQITALLLGSGGLDLRLAGSCRLTRPDRDFSDVPVGAAVRAGVARLAAVPPGDGLRVYLRGPACRGQQELAEAVAAARDEALLLAGTTADPAVASREALVQRAVLFAPDAPDAAALRPRPGGVAIASGTTPAPAGYVTVPLGRPDAHVRRACWAGALAAAGLATDEGVLDHLATRFRLEPAQIEAAVATTVGDAAWRAAADPDGDTPANVFAAARAQTGDALAALGEPIARVHGWEDLVLPQGALAQLRDLCDRVVHRERVLFDWGFDRRLAFGKGVTALFTGSSGTGKTMAAGVIASTLELDAYRIDLAGVVSPYIGETEQNLDRVFAAAESTNAILFFDEADALFGKRSEVRDSRDRYSNIEVSYLLQRMEAFDGFSILASNLQRNIDDAFLRRLDFTVHFPFPDAAGRRRIWEGMWPVEAPLAAAVDFAALADRFPLSGGSIRNAALAAAYLAAADGDIVGEPQLLQAVRRELQKLGRTVTDDELLNGVAR
jgi:hypothetical protein